MFLLRLYLREWRKAEATKHLVLEGEAVQNGISELESTVEIISTNSLILQVRILRPRQGNGLTQAQIVIFNNL